MGKPSDQKVSVIYQNDNCVPEDIEDTLVLYTHRILYFYFFFLKEKDKRRGTTLSSGTKRNKSINIFNGEITKCNLK